MVSIRRLPASSQNSRYDVQGLVFQNPLAAEPLLRSLPVDHIPDGAEVLSLAVLVLNIVLCEC